MLQGKALNVLSTYSAQAEELLSKAVKLDPRLVEAWIQLGEVYWKNHKVEDAKNCFQGALQHVSLYSVLVKFIVITVLVSKR